MIESLWSIAQRCDGVRCDMAILQLNDVFSKTWAHIPAIGLVANIRILGGRDRSGEKEPSGISFSPPKRIGDLSRVCNPSVFISPTTNCFTINCVTAIMRVCSAICWRCSERCWPRACIFWRTTTSAGSHRLLPAEHRAAALLLLGLPGMRLIHEGQLEGRLLQAPVYSADGRISLRTLKYLRCTSNCLRRLKVAVGRGEWKLLQPLGWPDKPEARKISSSCSGSNPRASSIWWLLILCLIPVSAKFGSLNPTSPPQIGRCATVWERKSMRGTAWIRRLEGLHFDLPAHGAQLWRFRSRQGA